MKVIHSSSQDATPHRISNSLDISVVLEDFKLRTYYFGISYTRSPSHIEEQFISIHSRMEHFDNKAVKTRWVTSVFLPSFCSKLNLMVRSHTQAAARVFDFLLVDFKQAVNRSAFHQFPVD
ncbi:hypothetical protein Trydic_g15755 [Trypoxylus dichotomus]